MSLNSTSRHIAAELTRLGFKQSQGNFLLSAVNGYCVVGISTNSRQQRLTIDVAAHPKLQESFFTLQRVDNDALPPAHCLLYSRIGYFLDAAADEWFDYGPHTRYDFKRICEKAFAVTNSTLSLLCNVSNMLDMCSP
ncbi:MAG TPA: hypothetical protein VM260_07700, partial [Pirellula sp.]|nr:hypothetical protein [Pirellula sp.]